MLKVDIAKFMLNLLTSHCGGDGVSLAGPMSSFFIFLWLSFFCWLLPPPFRAPLSSSQYSLTYSQNTESSFLTVVCLLYFYCLVLSKKEKFTT